MLKRSTSTEPCRYYEDHGEANPHHPSYTPANPGTPAWHGFRAKHSTVSALDEFNHQISRGFNRKKPANRTVLLQIDPSKAFDMVSHEKLLIDLNRSSIPASIERLLSSLLLITYYLLITYFITYYLVAGVAATSIRVALYVFSERSGKVAPQNLPILSGINIRFSIISIPLL